MKTFADILPILRQSFSFVTDDSNITYGGMMIDDDMVIFTLDDDGLGYEIVFSSDSTIIINTDGKIVATTTEGEPVILTFFKSVPIDFLS